MNVKEDKIIKDLYNTMRQADKKGTQGYDTPAEVTRIDGDTAWVHIPGGVEETPVKKTIDAKKGDTVQVRVSGGNAWITGNVTAPPTDDYTAKIANQTARKAQLRADSASDIANKAQASADGKNTIYYDATQPIATEGGFKVGDTWFNSAEDNAIYRYNGTAWVKEELGEDAIAELSIKTAHIQDGAITNAKVGNLDAGKITSGTINTNLLDVSGIISVGSIATDSEVSTAKSEAISTASADATAKANDARLYADNYLTTISGTTGISVHSANDTSNYVNISSSAVNVVVGGTNVSSFGSTVRVGANVDGQSRVEISSSGIEFKCRVDSSTTWNLANIEFRNAYGNHTIAKSPTFTFGVRASGGYGQYSFVVGSSNKASELLSTAFGLGTTASEQCAFAEGWGTTASGTASHASGYMTTASGSYQTVIGKYNATDTNQAFIIGNGSSSTPTNALTVDWSGNVVANSFGASSNMNIIPMAGNEINFGGNWTTNGNLYFGYRDYDGRTAPTDYYFGNATANANVHCNSLYINNTNMLNLSTGSGSEYNWVRLWASLEAQGSAYSTTNNMNLQADGYISFRVGMKTSGGVKTNPVARYNFFYDVAYMAGDLSVAGGASIGGITSHSANINMNNNCSVRSKNTSGTVYTMIGVNTSNQLNIGQSGAWGTVYVYATSTFTGNKAYSGTSDIRLKKDIEYLSKETDDVILNLKPFKFHWKDKDKYDKEDHYGVSAQELKGQLDSKSLGGIVTETDGYYGVRYSELIPMLIHLCQSQQREIEEIKEKLQ